MNDPPYLLRPKRHTSGGNQSPTRGSRVVDDILAHITPATAVEALSHPNETLRKCLADAGPIEREFSMRTAVAARTIWEWVDEMADWSWPEESGSKGFEKPGGKVRPLSMEVTPPEDEVYVGSLLEEDVLHFERMIEEIQRGLKELDVEGIKTHVMTNHILPLSRPATPVSGGGRSVVSFNRMEDLTAVVTAIVVQTLPNLARLHSLLQIWGIRVVVLRQIPGLESAIEDAEVALKSGWMAITTSTKKSADEPKEPTLSRKDFSVMKMVIEKKVTLPGRTLDFMLDRLEGLSDTLPDEWLDRMEAVERSYGEWVAACERRIRETEWAKASRSYGSRSPSPVKAEKVEAKHHLQPADDVVALPVPMKAQNVEEEPSKQRRDFRKVSQPLDDENITPPSSSPTEELPQLKISIDKPNIGVDGAYDLPSAKIQIPTPIKEESSPSPRRRWNVDDDICTPVSPESEPELPQMPVERRGSQDSEMSTMLHGASSDFGMLSDPPEVSASPGVARAKVREAEYIGASPEASPPSSPPAPEAETRESSLMPETRESSMATESRETSVAPGSSFNRSITEETETERDDATLPRTPLEGSFSEYFDDSFSQSVSEVVGSPSVRRDSTGDQHLRQQISDIIDNIPAKIKLSAEPPNLNPPDLQLPRLRKKPSKEPFKRSVSSMSSMSNRTATPSFTLSPAKNARPQRQRGQQEIKVYHLSRSTGEAPIKLFIRCVGENGERVMVRVGGGWADLSEYLKEYASHHGRRSKGKDNAKIEVSDRAGNPRSSPSSRPASAMETSPLTPLTVRKTRRSGSAMGSERPRSLRPNTPAPTQPPHELMPSSEERTTRSRSNSRLSWKEEDSSFLGLAGPSSRKTELSEENKAWVESVKEKVRLASGERKVSNPTAPPQPEEYSRNKFGELGKVGGTKRLFRRADGTIQGQGQKEGKGSR